MTSTSPTKKICVGSVPSSSRACEAPASVLAFQREASRVDMELVRDFSQVWISGEHPPILRISKGREWGPGGAEGSASQRRGDIPTTVVIIGAIPLP